MWKPFTDSGNLFMLSLEQGENELTLQLTDFLHIWETLVSNDTLVISFRESNPLIAATDHQIESDLLKIIDNLQNVKVSVSNIDESLVELLLEESCKDSSEYIKSQSIKYKFGLGKKSQDEFRNSITISSIQTIYFLEQQQKMLLNLVQKKDRELEEYRMEKGDISRGDLKTDKFNPESMNVNNGKLLLSVFTDKDSQDFWKKFTEKNGEMQATTLSVEAEPWNAKPRKRVLHSSKTVVKRGAGISYKK